jgi:histidinol-phosphate phosphatase family protein
MNGNITMIIGYPAAGKTLFAKQFECIGYHRLNRDELGGKLDNLIDHLKQQYRENGINKFVMDNTYTTAKSRKAVIEWAQNNEFDVDCKWIDIDVGDALYNASKRMIDAYGKLLTPEEIKKHKDVGIYPPVVIYKHRKAFEVPTQYEGFNHIRKIQFSRKMNKVLYKNKAVLLDYDSTLRKTISGEKYPKSPDDIEILPNRSEVLKKYQKEGYLLLGVSNQSFIAKEELTIEQADDCFQKTNELLGLTIHYKFCPHRAYPQVCYCRKPMPGMGVEFIEEYKLNPSECIMVGDMKSDNTFAE